MGSRRASNVELRNEKYNAARVREPMHWFDRVWQSMREEDQQRVRDKARWERMTLMGVLIDWPTLAPVGLRDLIPTPEADRNA